MRDMILLTLPDGSPILINENGLCIETERSTGRSVITLPHNHRHGKPTLTVTESFEDILNGLVIGNHLVSAIPARVPVPAPPPWEQSTTVPAPATIAILDDPKPASKVKGKKVGA